jgi:hypothetical protein
VDGGRGRRTVAGVRTPDRSRLVAGFQAAVEEPAHVWLDIRAALLAAGKPHRVGGRV